MTEISSPSHVQELLGIDSHSLRKYATLLEGNGYAIHRNSRGHRGYFEKDINLIRKFIDISSQEGMTLERSAQTIIASIAEENTTVEPSVDENSQPSLGKDLLQNSDMVELFERIGHLERINIDLIQLLKEKAVREAYLEDKMNRILKYVERSEQFLEEQSHVMLEETRKQIAAAQQKKWWKWRK